MTRGPVPSRRAAYYGVAVLTLLNFVNYVDRFILSAVLPRIKADLALTDTQLGLTIDAFLLAYFLTSPIFGRLGDRLSRTWLISVGVAIWSLATAAAGLARSFGQLFAARSAVGVGEASYATISPALISDYFPLERRGRVFAVFYAAIPVGGAVGYLLGGLLEPLYGWRVAFYIVGLPGLALALLALTTPDPPRGVYDDPAPAPEHSWIASLLILARNRTYFWTVLGYAAYTFAVGGLAYWIPTYLERVRHMELAQANYLVGIVTVVAGFGGTFAGGYLGDRLLKRTEHAYLYVSAASMLLAVPPVCVAFSAASPALYIPALFLSEFLVFFSTGPINVVIVNVVPVTLRATAVAVSIFAIHALGDMISPPLIGFLSERIGLARAVFVVPMAALISAALWWWATKRGRTPFPRALA